MKIPLYLFLIITSATALPARAIVSVEDVHLAKPREGWGASLALSGSGASGNTEKYDFSTGARLQWQHEDITDLLILSASYGRVAGETNTENSFAHLRHIAPLVNDHAWGIFAQANQNTFTRLKYRGLLGGGVRLSLTQHRDTAAAYLGLGAMYEREEIEDPNLTEERIDSVYRANIYLVAKYHLNAAVRFVSSSYYQPSFSEGDDFRALEEAELVVKLGESLDLSLSVNVAHDSRPPAGIERTDIVYSTGIRYEFK